MMWSHGRNQWITCSRTNRLQYRNGSKCVEGKAWCPMLEVHERTLAERGFGRISEVEMVCRHFLEISSVSKYPCSCMREWKEDVRFMGAASEGVLQSNVDFSCGPGMPRLALCEYAHWHASACVLWRHCPVCFLTLRSPWRWCGLIVANVLFETHEPIACQIERVKMRWAKHGAQR